MKLIIDIPEEKWKITQKRMYCNIFDLDMWYAIKKGVPLPKGHGDLKDASQICPDYGYCEDCHCGTECPVRSENIIIPADKEGDEDESDN